MGARLVQAKLWQLLPNFLSSTWKSEAFLSQHRKNVWDYDYVGDQRVVDVHIGQIRKKIEIDSSEPSFIQTVRGVGYKFEVDNTSNIV